MDELVKKTGQLLAMPRVVSQVLQLLDDQESELAAIADCLAQDPALVALLLRLANSPAFATSRRVESVAHALSLLGRDPVRRLVIAGAVSRASDRLPTQSLLPLEVFWRHSAYCAVIARLLAEGRGRHGKALADSVFLGGLLHDLGQLVMFSQQPEAAHRAFLSSLGEPDTLTPEAAERAELGFNHAELGSALAEHWGLPPVLCAMLRYHHAPLSAPEEFHEAVALVHLANTGAHLAELDSRDWGDAPPIEPQLWESLQIEPQSVLDAVEQAQFRVLSVEALREPEAS